MENRITEFLNHFSHPLLTEKQIGAMLRAFLPYDQLLDGNISSEDLGSVMHSLGQLPTKAEL